MTEDSKTCYKNIASQDVQLYFMLHNLEVEHSWVDHRDNTLLPASPHPCLFASATNL